MSVHSSGSGSGWLETLDVDQPEGLDYREFNDIRIGTRKRLAKEHETLGDSTAGGEHLPGGCRILGIVDSTADLTKGAGDASIDVTTGKFIGRSLIYDQTQSSLWCFTNTDGTTTGNPYRLMFSAASICEGDDFTWTGAHEFDATVDITGDVAINGSLQVDGTETAFGGSAGIGLFYDPTVYAGGENNILGNGTIIKTGNKNVAGTTVDVSFAAPFPTAIVTVHLTTIATTPTFSQYTIANGTKAASGFSAKIDATTTLNGFDWIAIGR